MSDTPRMHALAMPGHVIRRLHQRSMQVFSSLTQEAGLDLTSVQFAALDAIASHPGADQATIAQLIAFDRATIGGVIDRLLQKGWIERSVSARDRRAKELRISPSGHDVLAQLLPVVNQVQDTLMAPLTPQERQVFMTLASKVLGLEPAQARAPVDTSPERAA